MMRTLEDAQMNIMLLKKKFFKYIAATISMLVIVVALSSCSTFNSGILPSEDMVNKMTIQYMDDNAQSNPESQLFSLPVNISVPDTGELFYILSNSLYSLDKQKTDSKIMYLLSFYNSNNEEVLKLGVLSDSAVAIYTPDSIQYIERGVFDDFVSEIRVINTKYGILNTI
jgi:hypothetical protein